jgi:lysophospholipase L1-like esterase
LAILFGFGLWPGRTRAAVARLVAALLAVWVALDLADIALRALPNCPPYYREQERFAYQLPLYPALDRYRPNVDFEGEVFGDLANMSGEPKFREQRRIHFRTDSLGFRNEPGAQAQSSTVVVMGDSLGVGTGTTQNAIWPRRLSALVDKPIYNLSMPGTTPWSALLNLKLVLPDLTLADHALLLVPVFSGNDFDEHYGERFDPVQFRPAALATFFAQFRSLRNRSPLRFYVESFLRRTDPTRRVITRRFLNGRTVLFYDWYALHAERPLAAIPQQSQFRATLAAIDSFARGHQLHVAVVLFPSKEEVYRWLLKGQDPWSTPSAPSAYSTLLQEICQELHFPYLDITTALLTASKSYYDQRGALLWWYDDTHWNESGHEVVAQAIYDGLFRKRDE